MKGLETAPSCKKPFRIVDVLAVLRESFTAVASTKP